ncbi:hemolysin XhlA family protein [Vallitaleaceae bacterium 9-2]
MNEETCIEKHNNINQRLDVHDKRLNNHSQRIDELEQHRSRTETKIENLCEQIKSLVTTIKWAMGLTIGTLLSFFIWYIQNL